ncbi:MAG: AraC family transcriptional regulator [Lachnospiraceae bacterium]|jgi:AraC-like DNA-binding protein|nr:AraC family transcriptional regulator [Lachnospiraceae bacterium]
MQSVSYRENRQRGTVDFPLEFYHVTKAHPHYEMALHWHVEFEIIRVLIGTFTLYIDEQEYIMNPGDTAFIPAGSLHSGIPSKCVYECIVFDMNMLLNKNDSSLHLIRQIMDHEVELKYLYPSRLVDVHRSSWALFNALVTRRTGYELLVHGALCQLLGIIFSRRYYVPADTKPSRNHRRILQLKQVLEHMESTYMHPVTLEELAASVKMSPKYFCRFFKEMTHRTPMDYLNNYRVERACFQLITTNSSITDVAYATGFNDLSYFIKTFKRYKGTTPKKYLKS